MATNTLSKTANYELSQYGTSDPAKFLTNYNSDMAAIDAALKAIKDESDSAVPNTRKIAGLAMGADITLAQLIAAGLCPAPEGPLPWTPTLFGTTTAGTPTYVIHSGSFYKIGKLVLGSFDLQISSLGGVAGNILVGGLPSTPSYGVMTPTLLSGINLLSGESLFGHIDTNGITLMRTGIVNNNFANESQITGSLNLAAARFWYVEN